ncbi:hypothetical protein PP175_21270 [Aneurinibacillus sp. Ricciae_BoGa-3]|uniref:hypothetical protein n=1 Tax=Aneurinibacillus sp. Ricciae_BoGa-3 TaxID=3022697 RepID=UPI00233FF3D7|nr:hypothetical protein [Aneurinibacillus sp. Ricciae_BoGa-3]WCK53822.1 hypothetical protein PP175_21270 [Aneurinibacillus sp. Ricciae_BoGa-3]
MDKFKSRKFWMAIVGTLIIILNQGLGLNLPTDSVMSVAGVVVAYLFGQSIVDAKKAAISPGASNTVEVPIHDFVNPPVATTDEETTQPITEQAAIAPPAEVQAQPDPNQEKLAKIAALQLQINQLKAEVTQ